MAEITSGPAVPFALPGASAEVAGTTLGSYLGFTVRETSGAGVASVILYDNTNTGAGKILEEITLSGGESSSDFYPRPGRQVLNGIYAVVTGQVEGSVFQ